MINMLFSQANKSPDKPARVWRVRCLSCKRFLHKVRAYRKENRVLTGMTRRSLSPSLSPSLVSCRTGVAPPLWIRHSKITVTHRVITNRTTLGRRDGYAREQSTTGNSLAFLYPSRVSRGPGLAAYFSRDWEREQSRYISIQVSGRHALTAGTPSAVNDHPTAHPVVDCARTFMHFERTRPDRSRATLAGSIIVPGKQDFSFLTRAFLRIW